MLKKLLFTFVASLPLCVSASYSIEVDNIDSDNYTCRLTGVTNHDEIPEIFNINPYYYISGRPYTITAIAPDALNDLPNVVKIIIPKSITRIGGCSPMNIAGYTRNFHNCPKLQAYEVEEGNEMFTSNADGLLLSSHSPYSLIRVPQAIKCTSMTYTLPSNVRTLEDESFLDVTTIARLTMDYISSYHGNNGFNTMPYLAEVTITDSTGRLRSTDGIVYSSDGELVCFPPRKMNGSYTVPNFVTKIAAGACANAIYLGDINIPNTVISIGDGAFANTSLRKIVFPSKLQKLYTEALANCSQLQTITFNCRLNAIPARLAQGCKKLEKVSFAGGYPDEIGTSAFKDCTSLSDLTMSASVQLSDSAFYNTGFTTVTYNSDPFASHYEAPTVGKYAFGSCKNLTKIDLSAVNCSERAFAFQPLFAPDCPKLTDVVFPTDSYFVLPTYSTSGTGHTFGQSCNVKNIVIGKFNIQRSSAVFNYTGTETYKPNVYLLLNKAQQSGTLSAPTAYLCLGENGAKVNPIFYCEATEMAEKAIPTADCTFYIPGGCMDNYNAAVKAGKYVEEFFRLQCRRSANGTLEVYTKIIFPDMVKINILKVNKTWWGIPDGQWSDTEIPFGEVDSIELQYTVNGITFNTTYDPAMLGVAAVDEIEADATESAAEYFDTMGRRVANPRAGSLYIVRRGTSVGKEVL